jgi:hypothetical protein
VGRLYSGSAELGVACVLDGRENIQHNKCEVFPHMLKRATCTMRAITQHISATDGTACSF